MKTDQVQLFQSTIRRSANESKRRCILFSLILVLGFFVFQQQLTRFEKISTRSPFSDYRQLIDIEKEFRFVLNSENCSRAQDSQLVQVVTLVHSAPGNVMRRLVLRKHWARQGHSEMKLYFLFGSSSSLEDKQQLDAENAQFGDVIQGNFVDSYRNLTYKHVMALKWFTYFCEDTTFLLKLDDDVTVNVRQLINYLSGLKERKSFISCNAAINLEVQRGPESKWAVTQEEFPEDFYPSYCLGYVVLYSGDVVKKLYEEAQRTKYFWIDDVHVTGTLRQAVHVDLRTFPVEHSVFET